MLADESIVTLFKTFARRWTHKWDKTNSDPKARAVWLHDLRQLGVTDETIRVGLSRSAALEWPPSPAEFAAMCRPSAEDLGIPSVHAAWVEALDIACKRKPKEECSHPVVWHAYCEAGDIGHMPEEKGRKAFDYAYSVTAQMALRGEPLREIPKALPAPQEVRATPEEVEAAKNKALEQLDAIFGRGKS